MKSCKIRLEQIAEPANLREAFLRAARGKAPKGDVVAFRARLDEELHRLGLQLQAGTVPVGEATGFTIWEPKERRIHAPCFRERVLHHALIFPCEADFERWLIHDSYACRRGKGREAAVQRAEVFARRYRWFLKLDVARYFDSIPHERLAAEVRRRFRDARVVELWHRIIAAHETSPGRGLPIGALTSQHLANLYLGKVDRLVKESWRMPGYVRYMDDMALWGDDKESLLAAKGAVEACLAQELGLCVKDNWHLQPTLQGMDFLGCRVRRSGSVLNRASRRRFVRRWRGIDRDVTSGHLPEGMAQRRVLAMAAFVRSARRDKTLVRLFSGIGHRAPTASTAAAVGTTPPSTAAPPTATGTPQTTATTTWASARPSAHTRDPEGSPD